MPLIAFHGRLGIGRGDDRRPPRGPGQAGPIAVFSTIPRITARDCENDPLSHVSIRMILFRAGTAASQRLQDRLGDGRVAHGVLIRIVKVLWDE